MRANIQAFWLQKAGCYISEYEDAFEHSPISRDWRSPIRIAVADGATEASFSGLWAKLVAKSYVENGSDNGSFLTHLKEQQEKWDGEVKRIPLPWYAEEKLALGAFSSLLGLELCPTIDGNNGTWRSVAIGDSCLFQVRNDELIVCFPIKCAEDFNNRPTLISSLPSENETLQEVTNRVEGTWECGDTFYLMTDALACWFLRRWQLPDGDPLGSIRSMIDQGEFQKIVDFDRSDKDFDGVPMLKNDDVTLLTCSIVG